MLKRAHTVYTRNSQYHNQGLLERTDKNCSAWVAYVVLQEEH